MARTVTHHLNGQVAPCRSIPFLRGRRVLLCFLFLALAGPLRAEFRTFADSAGRRMQAELVEVNETEVKLRDRAGKEATFPLTAFSKADQDFFARQLALRPTDPRIVAGNQFVIDFPELGMTEDGQTAACEVRIPDHFDPAKPVPMLLWYGGGSGSSRIGGASDLVDPAEYMIVAIPYKQGIRPRTADEKGQGKELWEFQQPMLQKVIQLVPNIHPKLRIVGGTSNGAHTIGLGLSEDWKGFGDFFQAFVLHEGGSKIGGTFRQARSKPVLIIYGEKSESLAWQTAFNEGFKSARSKLTVESVPEAGHGLTPEGRAKIKAWITTTATPELLGNKGGSS